MRISIMGTGIVGRAHAEKLIDLGHEVMIGTRNVPKTLAQTEPDQMGTTPISLWLKDNSQVRIGNFDEVAKFGEIIIDVLRGEVVLEVFGNLDPINLENKIIIDIANVLDFSKGMPPTLLTHDGSSLGERLQYMLPKSKVVKTLNTVSAQLQINPMQLANGDHSVFMSGNDLEAKKVVENLLKSYGWKSIIDLGDITTARGTELMLPMWLRLWGVVGTPIFNYKIIR